MGFSSSSFSSGSNLRMLVARGGDNGISGGGSSSCKEASFPSLVRSRMEGKRFRQQAQPPSWRHRGRGKASPRCKGVSLFIDFTIVGASCWSCDLGVRDLNGVFFLRLAILDEMEDDEKELEHSSIQEKLDKELKELDRKLEQKEALQVALEAICSFLVARTTELEMAAYPALDELRSLDTSATIYLPQAVEKEMLQAFSWMLRFSAKKVEDLE
ncbi:hypothetical protein V8G54_016453 [Vigna mungo]|uniref:Uncharacterized protein n=1 Tax=Vigna mungo TaxID=3915 RepID=A0AAQ3NMZ4_VIGMU